ncbi:hypothetical protein BDA99DRAFT_76900 [Phascolomyces articulosus]|uniref:F-box domain-containing protein n=1 Tax=Phascolomyces articulosus TaxID=60185 RepID=A0AAD5K8H9_9FUNG|nr:hypothetical protein BDA99DRAFT_76900 [Phascolomyces articulosus]
MPDFITELPNEIATEILNHLSQAECIKCMRVCQQWYHQIPNLSNSVWKELTISVTCWDTVNECMLLCLGPHVKSVSILEHDTCAILNKLYEKSCIITSLGKQEEQWIV